MVIAAFNILVATVELVKGRRTELESIAVRTRFQTVSCPVIALLSSVIFAPTSWAFDPESGQLYIPSSSTTMVLELGRPDAARSDLDFIPQGWTSGVRGPQGLPLIKSPYARITAIDMNAGEHTWMTPHGDGPRNHPAIKHLELGPLGGAGFHAGGPLLTKTLLIVTHGGRDVEAKAGARCLSVYDKMSGEHLGSIPLPALPYGNPITYMHNDKQWIAVGGGPIPGRWRWRHTRVDRPLLAIVRNSTSTASLQEIPQRYL